MIKWRVFVVSATACCVARLGAAFDIGGDGDRDLNGGADLIADGAAETIQATGSGLPASPFVYDWDDIDGAGGAASSHLTLGASRIYNTDGGCIELRLRNASGKGNLTGNSGTKAIETSEALRTDRPERPSAYFAGDVAILQVNSIAAGGIATYCDRGSYGWAGDLLIGESSDPCGNIRLDEIDVHGTGNGVRSGDITVHGAGDFLIETSGGTAGDILAYATSGNGSGIVAIHHDGAFRARYVENYLGGAWTGSDYMGSFRANGDALANGASGGFDILRIRQYFTYDSYLKRAGWIDISGYTNVIVRGDDTGMAIDTHSTAQRGDIFYAASVTITNIAGNISILGSINLEGKNGLDPAYNGVLTCQTAPGSDGSVILAELDCAKVRYAALDSDSGFSLVGKLANFNSVAPNLRCPSGQKVYYDPTAAGNAYFAPFSYTLPNLAGTAGAGGTLAPLNLTTRSWAGDSGPLTWTTSQFDDGAGNGATAAGEAALFGAGTGHYGVTVDDDAGAVTAGQLAIAGANAYTLQPSGSAALTLDNDGAPAKVSSLGTQNHTIAVDLTLADDLICFMESAGAGAALTGAITGTGRSLTLRGPGMLTLSGANSYDGGTAIPEGLLVTKTSVSALGDGGVTLTGGALQVDDSLTVASLTLSSGLIDVRDDLTVSAGGIADGAGELLLNGAAAGLTLLGGGQIDVATLRVADRSVAVDSLPIAGVDDLVADSGAELTTAGNLTADKVTRLTLEGGTVTSSGDLTVANLLLRSGMLERDDDIVVTDSLTLDGMDLDLGAGTLTATGADITIGSGATLTASGTTACDTLTVSGGTVVGNIDATTKILLENATIVGNLGGAGSLQAGINDGLGTVDLQGNNSYAGMTDIDWGALRVLPNAANLAASNLAFTRSNGNTTHPAVLETSGLFARNIGTGNGEVRWAGYSAGGFAAYGGPLTVTLEDGIECAWSSSTAGFAGAYLMFGSYNATHAVTLTNPILLDYDRNIMVFDNPATDQDVAVLAGKISGPYSSYDLYMYRSGTLYLASNDNDFAGRVCIQQGAVRVTPNAASLPAANYLVLSGETDYYAILEASGTFARDIGQSANQVYWEERGGFAAYGAPLTVTLEGNVLMDWSSATVGFSGRELQFGSLTANDVVTLTNPIDVDSDRAIRVFDNPYAAGDRAVLAGKVTSDNSGYELRKYGDGLLELAFAGNRLAGKLEIYQGTARITGVTTCYWADVLSSGGLYGKLEGDGTLVSTYATVGLNLQNGGTLAPGASAAGKLTFHGSALNMENGSIYAFEFGTGSGNRDLVSVTGNLDLDSSWKLAVRDLGMAGRLTASDEVDLFTFTGTLHDGAATITSGAGTIASVVTDFSALDAGPGEWDYSQATVKYDADGPVKRVYLTGIKGGQPLPAGTTIVIR